MPAPLFALVLAAQAAPAVQLASAPTAGTTGAAPLAPAAAAPPAEAAPPPEDPMDHVVCQWQEPEGTRFGSHKVCHSRREWRRLQRGG